MLIYFVRHGIIQGHKDTKLNATGREEARLLGQALKDVHFDEAHSSSLSRARETAEILVQLHPNLSLSLEPGLMERGLGSLEGNRWVKGYKLPDDAEPSSEFQQRIYKWFSRFLQTHASTEKESHTATGLTILIVSHGAFLSTLFSILISSAVSFTLAEGVDRARSCRNTSIMKVRCWEERGEWKGEVLSWGHVPHLVEGAAVVSVADDLSKAE